MSGSLIGVLCASFLAQTPNVGVVSHVKVVSDKVPDVANLEAWAKSFLRDRMTDREKALAAWRSTVMFQHQDNPPLEFLQHEGVVQDPIKIFNVYGYSFCSDNSVTFSAGPPEGTVTIEGATTLTSKGKQLVYTDFHPESSGFEPNLFIGPAGRGTITFPIATPGDTVRLRFGAHYRARDARDGLDYQVSFDEGKSWKTVERAPGPTPGACRYAVCADVPAGTRRAWVRYAGTSRNATGLLNFRIDADYREPCGGFRPVRVTYSWEENGQARQHVHVAHAPQETYTIRCPTTPVMKALVLEVAE